MAQCFMMMMICFIRNFARSKSMHMWREYMDIVKNVLLMMLCDNLYNDFYVRCFSMHMWREM
jgi:hypothetical protein